MISRPDRLPKLHLVQNAPFTPSHDAWRERRDHDPEVEPTRIVGEDEIDFSAIESYDEIFA